MRNALHIIGLGQLVLISFVCGNSLIDNCDVSCRNKSFVKYISKNIATNGFSPKRKFSLGDEASLCRLEAKPVMLSSVNTDVNKYSCCYGYRSWRCLAGQPCSQLTKQRGKPVASQLPPLASDVILLASSFDSMSGS